jgi:hypothetical protein
MKCEVPCPHRECTRIIAHNENIKRRHGIIRALEGFWLRVSIKQKQLEPFEQLEPLEQLKRLKRLEQFFSGGHGSNGICCGIFHGGHSRV